MPKAPEHKEARKVYGMLRGDEQSPGEFPWLSRKTLEQAAREGKETGFAQLYDTKVSVDRSDGGVVKLGVEDVRIACHRVLPKFTDFVQDDRGKFVADSRLEQSPWNFPRPNIKFWEHGPNGCPALGGRAFKGVQMFVRGNGGNGRRYHRLDDARGIWRFLRHARREETCGYSRKEKTGLTWDVLLPYSDHDTGGRKAGKPVPLLGNRPIRAKRVREQVIGKNGTPRWAWIVCYNDEDCAKIVAGTLGDRLYRKTITERIFDFLDALLPQLSKAYAKYGAILKAAAERLRKEGDAPSFCDLSLNERQAAERIIDRLIAVGEGNGKLNPEKCYLPGIVRAVNGYTLDETKAFFGDVYLASPGDPRRIVWLRNSDTGVDEDWGPYREALGDANGREPGDEREGDHVTWLMLKGLIGVVNQGEVGHGAVPARRDISNRYVSGKNGENPLYINLAACRNLRKTEIAPDGSRVKWRGREPWDFRGKQASCVKVLAALSEGESLSNREIAERIGDRSARFNLYNVFRRKDGTMHPAWENFIVSRGHDRYGVNR